MSPRTVNLASIRRTSAVPSLILAGMFILAACAPVVNLDPAASANDPECANMIVRLPEEVAGLSRRSVNAQSTAAWGDPVAIIIRCGLPKPPPSPLPCFSVRGVDWLRDDVDGQSFVFTTFGLDPATEVIVDANVASGTQALQELSPAVETQSPPVARCLDVADILD
ncbi:MAG: DUF3515 family protein [Microbacteriaceae bacterium]